MKRTFSYKIAGEVKTVAITRDSDGIQAEIDDRTYRLTPPVFHQGVLSYTAEDQLVRCTAAKKDNRWYIHLNGHHWMLEEPASSRTRHGEADAHGGADSGILAANMPGQIVEVLVAAGDTVEQGQTLVLMEAMKMELHISAPFNGIVRQVHCAGGETVKRDAVLVEIEEKLD